MSSGELVRVERGLTVSPRDTVDGWIAKFEPTARLAEAIANTEFVPASLRGKPAAITAAILYGSELGLGPIKSLQSIDVIDGRPAVNAEMARALALSHGHELVVVESTTTRCVVRGRRVNSSEFATVTWTMDDAKRAGLDGRQNWRKHPRRMLQARATAELCHLLFADAIGGMPFTLEEIADDSDTGGVIGEVKAQRTAHRAARKTTVEAEGPALPGDEPDDPSPATEPAPDPEPADPKATRAQVTKLQTVYGSLGITDRAEKLATASQIVGRPLESSNDLTKEECGTLIDTLEKVAAAADPPAAPSPRVGSEAVGGGHPPPSHSMIAEAQS